MSMSNADRRTAKRTLVLTAVIAVIVIVGIVLFFAFGHRAEPLLSATTTITFS